jgi:predicted TIM-barrel fold metal-dependent hydrolase
VSSDGMEPGGIFDFHARLGTHPAARGALLAAMDAAGIGRCAVCAAGVIDLDRLAEHVMVGGYVTGDADNKAVADACAGTAGRLVPFFVGNPHTGPGHYLAAAAQFAGLELAPAVHGVPFTDQRNTALVEVAAAHGHPVYAVCIGRPGCGAPGLAALARQFPQVTFVLGHCGFVGIDLYSLNVIRPLRNVLAETSGCYTGIARIAIERLGADRVLFGTDYPLQHPDVELAKLRSIELDPASRQQVMWANSVRLLKDDTS